MSCHIQSAWTLVLGGLTTLALLPDALPRSRPSLLARMCRIPGEASLTYLASRIRLSIVSLSRRSRVHILQGCLLFRCLPRRYCRGSARLQYPQACRLQYHSLLLWICHSLTSPSISLPATSVWISRSPSQTSVGIATSNDPLGCSGFYTPGVLTMSTTASAAPASAPIRCSNRFCHCRSRIVCCIHHQRRSLCPPTTVASSVAKGYQDASRSRISLPIAHAGVG